MQKKLISLSIDKLRQEYFRISFPAYQREPNLWSLVEKQRLIDSIIRGFDIASLYFYEHDDGSIDCVDGRQRIGAIMSFLGADGVGGDVNFKFQHLNEVYEDHSCFRSLVGKSYSEIDQLGKESQDSEALEFLCSILKYPLAIVILSDSDRPEEFNLQFTRLNLGTIINSGEKLHAMVGDLRDECFRGLGRHTFLESTNIPTRRYAREQVAAQILAQIFSLGDVGRFTKTRHFDLQRIFKQNSKFTESQKEVVKEVSKLFDVLSGPFRMKKALRNRAITVSTVLLAWQSEIKTVDEAEEIASFIDDFVHLLSWQTRKGLLMDSEYHYLTAFQRHITQASVESSAVKARATLLQEEFGRWKRHGKLKGDADWRVRHPDRDPRAESRMVDNQLALG